LQRKKGNTVLKQKSFTEKSHTNKEELFRSTESCHTCKYIIWKVCTIAVYFPKKVINAVSCITL